MALKLLARSTSMSTHVAAETRTRIFLGRFQETVEFCPDRPAIVQGSSALTYRQLDRRSNAVAHALVRAGVAPDALVGLAMERRPDLLVVLLGILKAGAAYVPLDPTLPAARLAYMMDDARPEIVVADSSAAIEVRGTRCLRVDVDLDPRDEAAAPPAVPIDGAHRGYVLYTSGSTGAPKGVEITHASIGNLIDAFLESPGLGPGDRVLAHTALSFDISIIELWLSLAAGAATVLVPAPENRDGDALVETIAEQRVTFVTGTPSFFRVLLDAGWRDGRGVTVFCGGEPMSRQLADALRATGAIVWNIYGPTEITVWCSAWRVTDRDPIVVGGPIRNMQMHLLDPSMQPVREGEIGEVYIGGAGLARGYLHRPTLTAERFVRHPLAPPPDGRLYRTGDAARRHGHGFEIVGRLDRQLKIDGFRIEPGEIEDALARHDGVTQAIVCGIERSPGDTRLAAYIVHGANPPPVVDELLAAARERLPAHMIPSAFVMLKTAPLTPHGKLDYGALPPPDWRRVSAAAAVAAPRSTTEQRLRDIWKDVLTLDTIGIDENFFDAGGRSRLGATMFARVERDFGVRLPLATLFSAPTIASLASVIDGALDRRTVSWDTVVCMRRGGSSAPVFFVHPVGGNVITYRELARHIDQDVPCFGLQAVGLDGVRAPLTSVEKMAERYVRDLRAERPRGPYRLCGYSFGGLVAFAMAARLRAQGEDVDLLALIDTNFPEGAPAQPNAHARSGVLRRFYASIFRARRHAASLRRLGAAGYVRAIAASRDEDDLDMDSNERVRAANLRAVAGYIPAAYAGLLVYFRAADDRPADDRRHCWRTVAPAIVVVDIAGTHADLRSEPQVQLVAQALNARLARSRPERV
jgi:amino acid adenylation domain-containing protein